MSLTLADLSMSLRGIIAAPPGREIIGADFSAIEARVLAWLAGQQDLLQAFRDPKRDVYVEAAARSDSDDRNFGKLKILSCGYGLGSKSCYQKGKEARLKNWSRKLAYKTIKDYRAENKAIVEFWKITEDAVKQAIKSPGQVFPVGAFVKTASDGRCLFVRLPSGRAIRYWRPGLRWVEKTFEYLDENGELVVSKPTKVEEITFFTPAKDAVSMQMEATYSGSLVENLCQAVARDLLAHAVMLLDDRYPVVIHVHDSIASEVPAGFGSVEEFCYIMSTVPPWAPGLPLAASGYRDTRFRG